MKIYTTTVRLLFLWSADLLGINTSLTSGLSGFCLDEKVDQEKDWKKSSKGNGQVGTELNLKGQSFGGHGLNDAVHGEGRGGKSSNWHGSGSLDKGGLGNCNDQESERGRCETQVSMTRGDDRRHSRQHQSIHAT